MKKADILKRQDELIKMIDVLAEKKIEGENFKNITNNPNLIKVLNWSAQ